MRKRKDDNVRQGRSCVKKRAKVFAELNRGKGRNNGKNFCPFLAASFYIPLPDSWQGKVKTKLFVWLAKYILTGTTIGVPYNIGLYVKTELQIKDKMLLCVWSEVKHGVRKEAEHTKSKTSIEFSLDYSVGMEWNDIATSRTQRLRLMKAVLSECRDWRRQPSRNGMSENIAEAANILHRIVLNGRTEQQAHYCTIMNLFQYINKNICR